MKQGRRAQLSGSVKLKSPQRLAEKSQTIQSKNIFNQIKDFRIQKSYIKTKSKTSSKSFVPISKKEMRSQAKGKRQTSILHKQNSDLAAHFATDDNIMNNSDEIKMTSAMRYSKHKDQFAKLTKRKKITTDHQIIQLDITNDDKYALVLLKVRSNQVFHIQIYCLEEGTIEQEFTVEGEFLRADEIVQNQCGSIFCLPYYDNGFFKILTFSLKDKQLDLFHDINSQIGIDLKSQPPLNFNFPLIYCMFLDETTLFVNLYDSLEKNHWYFRYNYVKQDFVRGEAKFIKLKQPVNLDFPIGHFYDNQKDEIYCIYRHGTCVTIKYAVKEKSEEEQDMYHLIKKISAEQKEIKEELKNLKDQIGGKKAVSQNSDRSDQTKKCAIHDHDTNVSVENMVCRGLGKSIYYNNQALIGRCSDQIVFFRRCRYGQDDEGYNAHNQNQFYWKLYYSKRLEQIGQLYQFPGKQEFTVTTRKQIYYYTLDEESLKPVLIATIFNFMGCTQIVSGPKHDINISYKLDNQDFIITQRNSRHSFKVQIDHESRDKAQCIDLHKYNAYALSSKNEVRFYSQADFQKVHSFTIQSREYAGIQILQMAVSKDQDRIALLSGQILLHDRKVIKNLYVFQITEHQTTLSHDQIYKRDISKDFIGISLCLNFNNMDSNELFILDEFQMYSFNYIEENIQIIFRFNYELSTSPEIACFNQTQDQVLIGAKEDVLIASFKDHSRFEIDIDQIYKISEVKACLYCDGKFYILSNVLLRVRGLYLLEINEHQEEEQQLSNFLIRWQNQLEMGDCDIFLQECDMVSNRCAHTVGEHQKQSKELIICYKQIYSNQFNVIVVDISNPVSTIVFRHSSFHIWETSIKGLLLLNSNDFLTFTNEGTVALSLARKHAEKQFKDQQGKIRQLHSLHECSYLKIMPSNNMLFTYSLDQNEIFVNIQEQFTLTKTQEFQFQDIYKLNIQEMSLRELLLFQGLFSCSSSREIVKIIEEQPNPSVFFKTYLELDMCNLIQMLSFDSRCISALLNPNNCQNFQYDYPIFYKIRQNNVYETSQKTYSAIDIAIENNQSQALNQIIEYMVKYQNSFVHSYLFEENFTMVMQKNVNIEPLLKSDIFCHEFQFEDWPQTHTNFTRQIMPYNGSLFDLRFKYNEVFPQFVGEEDELEEARNDQYQKVYKIKYTLNLLPKMGQDIDDKLMDMFGDSEQLKIFETKVIKDLIFFKWSRYAKIIHYMAGFVHLIYGITFCVYTSEIYLENEYQNKAAWLWLMSICISCAFVYDFTQFYQSGTDYFLDKWNYVDQLHIWVGYLNVYFQYSFEDDEGPRNPHCQLSMIFCTIFMLIKTFFYLRIFGNMTALVIMMKYVISDLRVFIFFYLIQLIIFSIILGVLYVGNYDDPEDGNVAKYYKTLINTATGYKFNDYPGYEYKHISLFSANIMRTLRFSLGDYDFSAINHLNVFESTVFWITWVFTIMMTCIVFLNFIIAEVSQSYQKVQEHVQELILQERAMLIAESESMMFGRAKNDPILFPQYIVIREIEE